MKRPEPTPRNTADGPPQQFFNSLVKLGKAPVNPLQGILIGLIRIYQLALSPYFGSQCRFTPTCSQYAREAIEQHGAIKGSWLAIQRVGRCHPWRPGGHDPVPPP